MNEFSDLMEEFGCVEVKRIDILKNNLHGYYDGNTSMLYNEAGINDLYNSMLEIFDDFMDEYPNVNNYKNYFEKI